MTLTLLTLVACAPEMWMPLEEGQADPMSVDASGDTGWADRDAVVGSWGRVGAEGDTEHSWTLTVRSSGELAWSLSVDGQVQDQEGGAWSETPAGLRVTTLSCPGTGEYGTILDEDGLALVAVDDSCELRRAALEAQWTW